MLFNKHTKILFFIIVILFLFINFVTYSQTIDLNGWTVFEPSQDSRILYVSADGNDSTGIVYSTGEVGSDPTSPEISIEAFRTYAAAAENVRDGYPDWILFNRSGTYRAILQLKSGRSIGEYNIIGSYGNSGSAPIIIPDSSTEIPVAHYNDLRYFALIGLDFYSRSRDPDSEYFTGISGNSGIQIIINSGETVANIIFEGCKFRFFHGNSIQNISPGLATIGDFTIRRCVFLNNYESESGHSQGLFARDLDQMTIEDCIFDHNGWFSQTGSGGYGEATIFNHNTYFQDCNNVTFKNNIFIRPSSIGNKFTANNGPGSASNISIIDNLYIDGEIGISLGGNVDGADRFVNMVVEGNVFIEIGRSNSTARGVSWGIDAWGWNGGQIRNNVLVHNSSTELFNPYGIGLLGDLREVVVEKNTVFDINGDSDYPGSGIYIDDRGPFFNVSVQSNVLQMTLGDRILRAKVADQPDNISRMIFASNIYFSPMGSENSYLFEVGLNNFFTFSEWVDETGDTSTFSEYVFPDANRTIETYQATVGEDQTIDAFIEACRKQGRYNWNDNYSGVNVVPWFRSGYTNELPVSSNGTVPSGLRIKQ